MKEQERSPLTKEQKELIEKNLNLCYYWFNRHGVKSEDAQQSLLCNLCSYIHLYDPERGAFGTFIEAVFRSKLSALWRYENRKKRAADKINVSLQDVAFASNSHGFIDAYTYEDILGDIEHGFDIFEWNDAYKDLMKRLNESNISKHDFEIFLSYLTTGNQTQVARMNNISRQRVSQIVLKVRDVIKKRGWL